MKLLPLFLLITVLVAILGLAGVFYTIQLTTLSENADKANKFAIDLQSIRSNFLFQTMTLMNYVRNKETKKMNDYLTYKKDTDEKLKNLINFCFENSHIEYFDCLQNLEKEIINLDKTALEIIQLSKLDEESATNLFRQTYEPEIERVALLLEKEVNKEKQRLTEKVASSKNEIRQANLIFMCVTIFTTMFVLFLGLFINRKITKPLKNISHALDEISKGNFVVEIQDDGIKEINLLVESVKRTLKTMKLAVLETKRKK